MPGMDATALSGMLDVLRSQRRLELDLLFHDRWPSLNAAEGGGDEPRASASRIHDDAQAVMTRIDEAEQAMRAVLLAWERDPARRGAHLLQAGEEDAAAQAPLEPGPDPTVPAGRSAPDLPDTVPAAAPPGARTRPDDLPPAS